ncbi:MAG: hypothetical protein ABIH65_02955, partial [Nanoarchaeota archaeon]
VLELTDFKANFMSIIMQNTSTIRLINLIVCYFYIATERFPFLSDIFEDLKNAVYTKIYNKGKK